MDVTTYGAIGDGKTISTRAFQAAVDVCAAMGGGTVVDGLRLDHVRCLHRDGDASISLEPLTSQVTNLELTVCSFKG